MRQMLVVVVVVATGCASAARTCPSGARFASQDRATGRVEWCARTPGDVAEMPAPGRTYLFLLGMAPPAMSSGMDGPFTHWYPNGGVESHGRYVEDAATSVPDGVWGFWYSDGTRKSVGRYDRGRPVGCFSIWDERATRVTGMVDGDRLRVEPCEPPVDDALTEIEMRSHPLSARSRWGDVSLHAGPQGGAFGARNATQRDPDPSPRATAQAAVRTYLGRFRVGPALGLRLSDGDGARAYTAGVVAAIGAPLPHHLDVEAEARLGIQYLELTASRVDIPGTGSASFWTPLAGARLALSFSVTPTVLVVGGVGVDELLAGQTARQVRYCAPRCSPAITETWNLGGAAYGFDLGLRLLLR